MWPPSRAVPSVEQVECLPPVSATGRSARTGFRAVVCRGGAGYQGAPNAPVVQDEPPDGRSLFIGRDNP